MKTLSKLGFKLQRESASTDDEGTLPLKWGHLWNQYTMHTHGLNHNYYNVMEGRVLQNYRWNEDTPSNQENISYYTPL